MTPFEAVYGRKPPGILDYIVDHSVPAAVDSILLKRDQLLRTLHANIDRAQARMHQHANTHRSDKSFDVGDWVYIRLQPYRQTSVKPRHSNKLAKRFYEPFKIKDRIGSVAYRVALPQHAKIHDVFHVSSLRKCPDPTTAHVFDLPETFIDFKPAPLPDDILDFCRVCCATGWTTHLLIHWKNQSASERLHGKR
ncbi:unnamed protein product [Rhodiola kirilowii]